MWVPVRDLFQLSIKFVYFISSFWGILSILLNGLHGGTVVTILDIVDSLLLIPDMAPDGIDLQKYMT